MFATINEFLFPIFLFTIYLCVASVILYSPQNLPTASLENSEIASNERIIPEIPKEETTESCPHDDLYIQTETIIKNLNKRQSRQLCKPLGIQQKRGKVEKSLTFIKAEIISLYKENPGRVIAVLEEKLPELIASLTKTNTKIAS